ncbi:MAG TPA: aspartate aminotransferase family protein [Planctomycetes bacterium]|nr:aspartate aminotransferase family protein [Planctomycetota bacterium]
MSEQGHFDEKPPLEDQPAGEHWNAEEFRRRGYQVIDWLARYFETVESLPVCSQIEPGEIFAALPEHPPASGEPFEAILADLDKIVMPGITHWQHPSWFAYFNANTSGPSILADLVSSGLGVQGMLWQTSPACTEVETRMLDWLVELLGLPDTFLSTGEGGGVIQDTASSATLCALVAARERATNFEVDRSGVDGPLAVYASKEAHSSVEKSVRIAGIGQRNLRLIDTDDDLRMDPGALRVAIDADRDAGITPVMVVATIGTTATTAIDPVRKIAEVCFKSGIWLHADAAHAGTAAVLEEMRWIHDGLELVDSYCFNPHKWMFVNFDCNAFWVRDRSALVRALSVLPEYLRNSATESGKVIDYRDWHIPLGRRFRSLKLWFTMRHYGVKGLRRYISEHISWAGELEERVLEHPDLELAAPRTVNLVCLRHRLGDEATRQLIETVNADGTMFVTHAAVKDCHVMRICIGGTTTGKEHVDRAWQRIDSAARKLG